MRIIFVCGSLKLGQDGVGDYTAKIAYELKRNGHFVSIIAMNDRYAFEEVYERLEKDGDIIDVLRIPSLFKWSRKHRIAQNFVESISPDWISLQFVPYSFHRKGLPIRFCYGLRTTFSKASCHVMFHEIWQGESVESNFKDRLIGFLQKSISSFMLNRLKTKWITTTNRFYADCLMKQGIKVEILPVFSNIPRADKLKCMLLKLLPGEIMANRHLFFIGVFFGGLHTHECLANNLLKLSSYVKRDLDKELIIVHVGKSPNSVMELSEISNITGIKTFVLGETDGMDISNFLSSVDVGLSNYPKVLFEKSGSVAAMLYNDLPVIFLKESFEPDGRAISEVIELDKVKDVGVFVNQDKSFYFKYGAQFCFDSYLKNFNK